MAKKYPSELNTKTVRINLGDWALLTEISQRADVTIAEALHLVIEQKGKVIKVSSAQPAFEVAGMPAFKVTGMPTFKVTGMPTLRVAPVTTIATNGSKGAALRIKSKGVRHE